MLNRTLEHSGNCWNFGLLSRPVLPPTSSSSPGGSQDLSLSLHNFSSFCSAHSCPFCVCAILFPSMISEQKPAAGTDLACYHLVAGSLKEAFKALSADTARHWQGILKGFIGDLEHAWSDQKRSTLHSRSHARSSVSV